MKQKECKCSICENGPEATSKFEQEMMAKYGWYVHMVQDPNYPLGINYHTHGLDHTYKVMDIQIVYPLPSDIAMNLFHECVGYIDHHGFIEENVGIDKIIRNYKCKFLKVQESGRDVLRMIIPDKDGNLGLDASGNFKDQHKDISYLYN